jgi:hypothetical protein
MHADSHGDAADLIGGQQLMQMLPDDLLRVFIGRRTRHIGETKDQRDRKRSRHKFHDLIRSSVEPPPGVPSSTAVATTV